MMHPGKGEEILKPIKNFERIIPIIKCHHERVDGKGYPCGLKDRQIPLLARILCLADSFDAMTAERPYKKAQSKALAIAQIKQKAGSQFDPGVVDAFLRTIGEEPGPGEKLIEQGTATQLTY